MNEVKKIDAIPVTEYETYDKIQMCIDDILKKKKNTPVFVHPLICNEIWYMHENDCYRAQFLLDDDTIGAIKVAKGAFLTGKLFDKLFTDFSIKLPVYGVVIEFKTEPVNYGSKRQIERYVSMLNDKLAEHRNTFKSFLASITNTKEVPIERVSCGITSRAIGELLRRGIYLVKTNACWYNANTQIMFPVIDDPIFKDKSIVINIPDHAIIIKYTVDIPKEVVDRFEKMEKVR